MKEKSHVNDIDRSIYDIRDVEKDAFRLEEGLTEDIVRKISEEKNDPQWMTEFRLNALRYIMRCLYLIGVPQLKDLIWTTLQHM